MFLSLQSAPFSMRALTTAEERVRTARCSGATRVMSIGQRSDHANNDEGAAPGLRGESPLRAAAGRGYVVGQLATQLIEVMPRDY
jgi:hypothetical protein